MSSSLTFCFLWIAIPVSLAGMAFAIRNFASTLQTEAPDVWEGLGRPKWGLGPAKRENGLGMYIFRKEYVGLNRPKLNRAGAWVDMARNAVMTAVPTVICYYGFKLIHLIAQ